MFVVFSVFYISKARKNLVLILLLFVFDFVLLSGDICACARWRYDLVCSILFLISKVLKTLKYSSAPWNSRGEMSKCCLPCYRAFLVPWGNYFRLSNWGWLHFTYLLVMVTFEKNVRCVIAWSLLLYSYLVFDMHKCFKTKNV